MTPRIYDRLAAALSVVLLLALAAGTYFLAQISLRDTLPAIARAPAHEPDYFVEDVVFTRINARGDRVRILRPGTRLVRSRQITVR